MSATRFVPGILLFLSFSSFWATFVRSRPIPAALSLVTELVILPLRITYASDAHEKNSIPDLFSGLCLF